MERSSPSKKRQQQAGSEKGVLAGDGKHLQLQHRSLLPWSSPSHLSSSSSSSRPPAHRHLKTRELVRQTPSSIELEWSFFSPAPIFLVEFTCEPLWGLQARTFQKGS